MKQLIVALIVALNISFSGAAFAWSPLGGFESAVEDMWRCYLPAASENSSEESDSAEEEEEEPDCE